MRTIIPNQTRSVTSGGARGGDAGRQAVPGTAAQMTAVDSAFERHIAGSGAARRPSRMAELFAEVESRPVITEADADGFVDRRIDDLDGEHPGRGWVLALIDAVVWDEGLDPSARVLVAMYAATLTNNALDGVADWPAAKSAAWALLAVQAKLAGDEEQVRAWVARAVTAGRELAGAHR